MKKILVIEDNPDILRILYFTLMKNGYDVKVAHNGIEGIELLNNNSRIDLVISDIQMQGVTGNQVARYIREKKELKGIPLIAISGTPDDVQRELFNAVLAKPFKLEDLFTQIYSCLGEVFAGGSVRNLSNFR